MIREEFIEKLEKKLSYHKQIAEQFQDEQTILIAKACAMEIEAILKDARKVGCVSCGCEDCC